MASRKLERLFSVSRVTFQPAPAATNEEARRVHRVRVPLLFAGKDPAAVLDFATRVRGDELAVEIDPKDGEEAFEFKARIESAGVKMGRGEKRPPITVQLLVESPDVKDVEAILAGVVRIAKAQLLEVDVSLAQVQPRLPGMEEDTSPEHEADEEEDGEGKDEEDGKGRGQVHAFPAAAQAAADGKASKAKGRKKSRRRPKGSSAAPATS